MAKQALTIIKEGLEAIEPKYVPTLPEHVNPARFKRALMTAVQNTKDIGKASRSSIYLAVQKAAQDGLLLDGREAALVVFKGKHGITAQYMPMIAGTLKKIRQSGQLSTISAHVVYENDKFDYFFGDDEGIIHKPTLGERGEAIAVYAIANLKDGSTQREVMSVPDVEAVRKSSRSPNVGPWNTHWGEMARKTVLRRLSKYLPQSSDLEFLYDPDPMYDFEGEVVNPRTRRSAKKTQPTALENLEKSEAKTDDDEPRDETPDADPDDNIIEGDAEVIEEDEDHDRVSDEVGKWEGGDPDQPF